MSKSYTIKEVKEFIENNSNCKLVSAEYENNKTPLSLRCKCGTLFKVSFATFKYANKRQCNSCAGVPDLNLEIVKKMIEEETECTLLSTEYINARKKLKFRCKCGKEFERTLDNLKRRDIVLCSSCSSHLKETSDYTRAKLSKLRQKPIEEVIGLVENQMKCKYIKRYTKKGTHSTVIVFKCSTHGIQEAYWTNLVKRKGCPLCNEFNKQNSKGMLSVENWLKENNIQFIKEMRFPDCKDKRRLPFDYWLSDKNICIEVDGRQHYEKAYFGNIDEIKAEKALIYTQIHDEIKTNYCRDNNIGLIRIPHTEFNNIGTILGNVLP